MRRRKFIALIGGECHMAVRCAGAGSGADLSSGCLATGRARYACKCALFLTNFDDYGFIRRPKSLRRMSRIWPYTSI